MFPHPICPTFVNKKSGEPHEVKGCSRRDKGEIRHDKQMTDVSPTFDSRLGTVNDTTTTRP